MSAFLINKTKNSMFNEEFQGSKGCSMKICQDPNNNQYFDTETTNRSIKSFYKNSNIFITGGTGFLGKALIEKLLRTCSEVNTIFVLMRSKRGLSTEQRYKEFLKLNVFDRVKAERPNCFDKLICISGDITEPNLGLSKNDIETILKNVNIVFHSAATVKFNEGLKSAGNLNACGTLRLMELCSKIDNLKAVIHVSTAYCNPGRKYVGENIYPTTPPIDKDSFMKCINILPDEVLNSVADQLKGSHPNTYTLTKSIAEQIVHEFSCKIPICIIRPSIVTAAIEEPYPGWVDNIQGITGIMMEIGRGTITSILGDKNLICDIIPVDTVVNTMIGAAWDISSFKELDPAFVDFFKNATIVQNISKTIKNELLNCINKVYLNETKEEAIETNSVALKANEITDVTCQSYLVLTLRYIKDVTPVERFMGFFDIYDLPPKELAGVIKHAIKIYNLKDKRVAQTYDGVAVMNDCEGGVQTILSSTTVKVYNCTSGQINPITWKNLGKHTTKWARINPTKYVMLYPRFRYRRNEMTHNIILILMHYIPAIIFDIIMRFQGAKPIMMKIARKFKSALKTGSFFSLHEWIFENRNQKILTVNVQSADDGNEFNCSIDKLDYDDYIRNYMLGIRKFILKDGEESMDRARKKLSRIFWIRTIFQFILLISVGLKLFGVIF